MDGGLAFSGAIAQGTLRPIRSWTGSGPGRPSAGGGRNELLNAGSCAHFSDTAANVSACRLGRASIPRQPPRTRIVGAARPAAEFPERG